jgi:hypothetical protein
MRTEGGCEGRRDDRGHRLADDAAGARDGEHERGVDGGAGHAPECRAARRRRGRRGGYTRAAR